MSVSRPERGQLSPGASRYFDGADWGWRTLWLTAIQVVKACRTHFGVPALEATLLADGMLNQTWRVVCRDRDRVLRVSRAERTVDQVAYERAAAAAWAAAVPEVVVAEHVDFPIVDGHALTIFPYVDGISGTTVPGPRRAGLLAPKMAAMHRAALELGLPQRPGFSAIDEQPRWFGWAETRKSITARFGSGMDVLRPTDVVQQAIDELEIALDRWEASGRLSVRGTVHGDLNARNQLYRDGCLAGIIDTDDCRVEPLIWEVASLAYSDPAVSPTIVWRDYLAAGGPLDPADEELLVHFARIGALTEIVWMTDDNGAATHLALHNLAELAEQLTGGVSRG
jgi:Ser/Thr protein kinase RdoA (MazF antagonist)